MFRRRRKDGSDVEHEADGLGAPDVDDELDEDVEDAVAADGSPMSSVTRGEGPFDVADAPEDGLARLDVGGLRVPGADGMELRLEIDEAIGTVQAVTVVHGDSSMQLMAFAAPRTEGIWDEVREEIRKSLASQGLVDQVDGDFGRELRATIPVVGPQGQSAMQPVRFVGVDGPRWFVRALFAGRAAREPEAAAGLEAVLRATVVVRGSDPMAPGDPLPLHVPGQLPPGMSSTAEERPTLTMPERGPEITEIR